MDNRIFVKSEVEFAVEMIRSKFSDYKRTDMMNATGNDFSFLTQLQKNSEAIYQNELPSSSFSTTIPIIQKGLLQRQKVL